MRPEGSYDVDHRSRVEREQQLLVDAQIQAKATQHHAQQFRERFPQQVEICLRLVFERLQNGLHKANQQPLSNQEVNELATAASQLFVIHQQLK